MRIMMLTNIYRPLVGGITLSIEAFSQRLRDRGCEVLVVTPEVDEHDADETDVVRVPAVPRAFKGKYSLPLPVPGNVQACFRDFRPDVVHAHHPFFMGVSARRGCALWDVPLVYTHHTRYDVYLRTMLHVPDPLREMFGKLVTHYCEACNAVVAPGERIARILREEGVTTPIVVIPTGVDVARFSAGDGAAFRRRNGIPAETFVVGHVGRLSPEKNGEFLARAAARFLVDDAEARFVLVGEGESADEMLVPFERAGVEDRVHAVGRLEGADLVDAYDALDVFAFASQSETQGMVVTEAMAAGNPVVALQASGVEDVVVDGENGRLLPITDSDEADERAFANALADVRDRMRNEPGALAENARRTAAALSLDRCADRLHDLYAQVIEQHGRDASGEDPGEDDVWSATRRFLAYEWDVWADRLAAFGETLVADERSV
jgi:1,2-diacylglycerol 3-alpha-glucosyltransferase